MTDLRHTALLSDQGEPLEHMEEKGHHGAGGGGGGGHRADDANSRTPAVERYDATQGVVLMSSSSSSWPQLVFFSDDSGSSAGACDAILTFLSYAMIALTFPITLWACFKVSVYLQLHCVACVSTNSVKPFVEVRFLSRSWPSTSEP